MNTTIARGLGLSSQIVFLKHGHAVQLVIHIADTENVMNILARLNLGISVILKRHSRVNAALLTVSTAPGPIVYSTKCSQQAKHYGTILESYNASRE